MSTDSTCASMHSSASAQSCDDEHNIWNPILGLCCHYHVNKYFEELLSEEDLGRIARSSRFALDPFVLQRRSFGRCITFATIGHVTYCTIASVRSRHHCLDSGKGDGICCQAHIDGCQVRVFDRFRSLMVVDYRHQCQFTHCPFALSAR